MILGEPKKESQMKNLHVRFVGETAAVVALAITLSSCGSAGGPPAAMPAGGVRSSFPASSGPADGALSDASGANRVVFVSNLIGGVRMYSADIHQPNPPLIGTIANGTARPEGVWIDPKGTLYVTDAEQYPIQANLLEYKHGASSPFRTITSGLFSPAAVAVGADGTVYVNALNGDSTGEVVEYAPGKVVPERTITLPDPGYTLTPGDLAFDRNGNLLAATLVNTITVHVFKIAPGSSKVTDLDLQGPGGAAIGVDGAGNLYTGGLYQVAVYPPGATSPSRTFPLTFFGNGLTVARNGTLYVVGNLTVAEFAPGASSPTNYINTDYGETGTFDAALGEKW
jgi:hypothetical protein